MRKRNTLALVITLLAVICLILMAIVLSLYMSDDTFSLKNYIPWVRDHQNSSINDGINPSHSDTEDAFGNGTEEDGSTEYPAHQFIIVGDSRTVAMEEAVHSLYKDSCIYIAKASEGYDWFINYGSDSLNDTLSQIPESKVIFNLGVNDLVNIDSYLSLYQSYMDEYPEISFYFMSVNPVDENYQLNVSNENISAFNEKLLAAFPNQFIDTYHYLTDGGFTTVDGLHYDQETSRKLHRFLIDTLK